VGGGVTIWQLRGASTPMAAIGQPAMARGRVASVDVSASGRRVAVGRTKGLIEVWDVVAGKIVDRIATDRTEPIVGVAFNAAEDTLLFALGGDVQSVRGGKMHRLRSHQQPVRGLRTGPDSRYAVTWSDARDVHVWNLSSCMVEASLQLPTGIPSTLAVDASGKRLAWGHADGTITLRDIVENERLLDLKMEQGPVTAISFSVDGALLGALSPSSGLIVWNLRTQEIVRQLPAASPGQPVFQRLFFSADGQRILAQRGGRIDSIPLATQDEPTILVEGRGMQTDAFAADPDANRLACGGPDQSALWVFDLTTGKPPLKFDEPAAR
jgi:WD40 repeat protein